MAPIRYWLVNLIGDDIRTIERNTDVLLNACKDIGLAVNTGKTKYMEIRCHRGRILRQIFGPKRERGLRMGS